jgi:hypothetical protein
MRNQRNQLITAVITGCMGCMAGLFALPASASLAIPNGWYVEGNAGGGKISDYSTNGRVSSSTGIGWNVNVGYKFMPYLSAEAGYTQYPLAKIKDQFDVTAGKSKHYSYDFAAKGVVPIVASGFEVFAKLGIQRSVVNISTENQIAVNNINLNTNRHSDTGLFMGLGGQYYFTPELAGVAQWTRAKNNSNVGTLDLYSLGLSIIFE